MFIFWLLMFYLLFELFYFMSQVKKSFSTADGNVASLNCKGLNNPIKSSEVLHYLRNLDTRYILNNHLRDIDGVRLKKS